jgi:Mak10 subunit, NatC N(alpha)-terminal acetyltransferase
MEYFESPAREEFNENGPPEPKRELYIWKEITNEFFESVEELVLGELLHYEMFGLFEAMSAIEMMDKKMDIGMIDGKEKNIPLTFEVAVQVALLTNSYWNFSLKKSFNFRADCLSSKIFVQLSL